MWSTGFLEEVNQDRAKRMVQHLQNTMRAVPNLRWLSLRTDPRIFNQPFCSEDLWKKLASTLFATRPTLHWTIAANVSRTYDFHLDHTFTLTSSNFHSILALVHRLARSRLYPPPTVRSVPPS
jgi:hypothetical protein